MRRSAAAGESLGGGTYLADSRHSHAAAQRRNKADAVGKRGHACEGDYPARRLSVLRRDTRFPRGWS